MIKPVDNPVDDIDASTSELSDDHMIEEMRTAGAELLAMIRENFERLDALPEGAQIMCPDCHIPHLVEAYR